MNQLYCFSLVVREGVADVVEAGGEAADVMTELVLIPGGTAFVVEADRVSDVEELAATTDSADRSALEADLEASINLSPTSLNRSCDKS